MGDTGDVEVPELNATSWFEPEGWSRLVRFGKTPKGLLLGILIAFVILAAPFVGFSLILPNVIACVVTAALPGPRNRVLPCTTSGGSQTEPFSQD